MRVCASGERVHLLRLAGGLVSYEVQRVAGLAGELAQAALLQRALDQLLHFAHYEYA